MEKITEKHVAIVGGGLVGALQACFLARRGYKVDVYEQRPDIRQQKVERSRSLCLTLSRRGRDALARVGIEDVVARSGIPMFGNSFHLRDGRRIQGPFGRGGQSLISFGRRHLNELLVIEAEKYSNVTIHFGVKLIKCDFDSGSCEFETLSTGTRYTAIFDLIVGCDGTHSSIRQQIIRVSRLDFSQEYAPEGYMDFFIPAVQGKQFPMDEHYLHLWPRDDRLIMAFPEASDRSFTLTLFMPFALFDSIRDEKDLLEFFENEFPDAVPLIGKDTLVETFFNSKPMPMVSVKCSPYHLGDNAVLLGDAAHAMAPYYGQGMNCGFEDCLLFDELMDKHNEDLSKVLPSFSSARVVDAQVMCDLALQFYAEMSSGVGSFPYLIWLKLNILLNWLMPKTWIPLYPMIAFTRIPYRECAAKRDWQNKILRGLRGAGVVLMMFGALGIFVR